MRSKYKIPTLLILSSHLLASVAVASSMPTESIYERTDNFSGSVHVTDTFSVSTNGLYQATLKDFEDAVAFKSSMMNITRNTVSLGSLHGTGSFIFKAGPGAYNVSMLAAVGGQQVSAKEKQKLIDENRKQHGLAWAQNLTREEMALHRALWKSRTKEERLAHQEKARKRAERRVEKMLASINTGTYGIEIQQVENIASSSAVPLPASAWLLGSGILGLAGLGRLKVTRKIVPG